MPTLLAPVAIQQFKDNNGNPLVGGQLYTYQAGTSIPAPSYTDATGTSANTNPVILNSRGEAPIWLIPGQFYKLVLMDAATVLIWSADQVPGGFVDAALLPNTASSNLVRSDLLASPGSSLVGFLQSGAGAVGRTLQAKLMELVNVKDYGAIGDGSADDTAAIQACANFLAVGFQGGIMLFPPGVYKVTATITVAARIHVKGSGVESTIIKRSTDYGDTFIFGSATDSTKKALANKVSEIFFLHDHAYTEMGGVALTNRVITDSVHLRFYGAQRVLVERCLLWHMKGQIVFHGGTVNRVLNCDTYGVWDNTNVNLQECQYSIAIFDSTVHGWPKDFIIQGNNIYGLHSAPRAVSFGSYGSRTYGESIGPKNGLFCNSLETVVIDGNYIGQCNEAGIAVTATNFSINWRIANNFFDENRLFEILFSKTGANYLLGVTITGNNFNGQGNAMNAIFVSDPGDASPVVSMLTIGSNVFHGYVKAPIFLGGAWGASVINNVISDYNCKLLAATDGSYASACFVTGSTKNLSFSLNVVGGGGNNYSSNTGYLGCNYGIYGFGAGISNIDKFNNLNAGLLTGGLISYGV